MSGQRDLATCAEHGLTYDPQVHSGCVVCRRSQRPLPPAPPSRKSHAPLYAAMGTLSIVLIGGALSYAFLSRARTKVAARAETSAKNDDAEREERQTPVGTFAPAPLPKALPLEGPVGTDTDGYPTQYVDRPALRSLLWHRKLAELSAYFERFQDEFEADPKREYWPHDAAETFGSAETELADSLDEWVKATPDSFAPYVARGAYWTSVAYARRGGDWASNTSAASFDGMREALGRAAVDLDRAIAIRPKLVVARTLQMTGAKATSDDARVRTAIDQATTICPTCYQPRVVYMFTLEPRWGGSYAKMAAFARASASVANPKMRLLPGFVNLDKAVVFAHDQKYDDALLAIQRACVIGEAWNFLLERALIQEHRENVALAVVDLDRAAVLRPGLPEVLFHRAWAHAKSKEWERAGRDLLDGLRVDPTDDYARASYDWIVQGLDYEGWTHFKAARRDDALRVYELLHELAPTNPEVNRRRQAVVSGNPVAPPSGDDVAALEDAVKATPDDLRAYQRLDYALARQGKFDRVVAMWTEYLARHPSDGTAYLERGGANFQLRKLPEAHADAAKACELGVTEGCARAKQLAGMMK